MSRRFLPCLLAIFLISPPKNSINGVTLSAGSHLDLGVIVMVQKNQTSVESCRNWEGDGGDGDSPADAEDGRTAIERGEELLLNVLENF